MTTAASTCSRTRSPRCVRRAHVRLARRRRLVGAARLSRQRHASCASASLPVGRRAPLRPAGRRSSELPGHHAMRSRPLRIAPAIAHCLQKLPLRHACADTALADLLCSGTRAPGLQEVGVGVVGRDRWHKERPPATPPRHTRRRRWPTVRMCPRCDDGVSIREGPVRRRDLGIRVRPARRSVGLEQRRADRGRRRATMLVDTLFDLPLTRRDAGHDAAGGPGRAGRSTCSSTPTPTPITLFRQPARRRRGDHRLRIAPRRRCSAARPRRRCAAWSRPPRRWASRGEFILDAFSAFDFSGHHGGQLRRARSTE